MFLLHVPFPSCFLSYASSFSLKARDDLQVCLTAPKCYFIHYISIILIPLISFGSRNPNSFHSRDLTYPPNGDDICKRVFGFFPKDEQREVVKHIGRGEDCILIAGCGWGKTLAYFLPLALWDNTVIVIVSPLVALMEEQQMKLQAVGICSIALCGQKQLPDNFEEELIGGKYRAVLMSPEAAFNNVRLKMLWNDTVWRSKVQAVVIDEAHCISTWGPEFRKEYSRIGDLRSSVPPGTAFVAVSATLHGQLLQDVKRSLHFSSDVFVIRADTDRPNIRYEVQVCKGNIGTCYQALEGFLDSKKTIVYFDRTDELLGAFIHLHTFIGSSASQSSIRSDQIVTYFADLAPASKQLYMSKFKRGEVLLMLSTEAAGMGCDISDVLRVVQFRFPKTITALAQRLGRAARDPNLQGSGILIYPRTDSTKVNSMESDLRGFIATDCRRKHFNHVFDNKHKIVDNCCDLCDQQNISHQGPRPDFRMVRSNPRPMLSRTFRVIRQSDQQLQAKEKIVNWRRIELQELMTWAEFYNERCVMDDGTINVLSSRFGDIAIAEDIGAIVDWSELIPGSKQRLTNIIVEYNQEIESQSSRNDKRGSTTPDLQFNGHHNKRNKSSVD